MNDAPTRNPHPETRQELPMVLTIAEVAAIMRTSVKGIHGKLSRGTLLPLPIAEHPYRWNRHDIERWMRGDFREAEARLRQRARKRESDRRQRDLRS